MVDFVRIDGLKDRTEFERLLGERFPEVTNEIDDFQRGLLHLEMAVFARSTCKAIARNDYSLVQAHLNFIDEVISGSALRPG